MYHCIHTNRDRLVFLCKDSDYFLASAPAVTGSAFMQRLRLFLGHCVKYIYSTLCYGTVHIQYSYRCCDTIFINNIHLKLRLGNPCIVYKHILGRLELCKDNSPVRKVPCMALRNVCAIECPFNRASLVRNIPCYSTHFCRGKKELLENIKKYCNDSKLFLT